MKAQSLTIFSFLGAIYAEEWQVTTYSGLRCTGQSLTQFTDLGGGDDTCRMIQLDGVAATLVFSVGETAEYSWNLGIHQGDNCLDRIAGGSAELFPGAQPYCLELNGANYFSVDRVESTAVVLRKSTTSESNSNTAVAARGPSELSLRQPMNNQYDWVFSRIAPTVSIASVALQTCPDFFTGGAGNAIACGLTASIAIAFSVLIADEFRRTVQRPGNPRARDAADLYEQIFGITNVPNIAENIMPGVTATLTKLPQRLHAGAEPDPILHISIQMTSDATGMVYQSLMDFDTTTNHTVLNANARPQSSDRRRQDDSITAYYSYDGFGVDAQEATPPSEPLARQLGRSLWDYAQGGDDANFCANLQVANANGFLESVNVGYFALITGRFADQLSSCPL